MATTRTSGPRTAFLLKFLPTVVIITCLLSLRPLLHIVRDRRSPGRNLSAATMLPPSSPTLGPQLPSFSGAELQIVVLTMIRPESLKRLLISLENVDYLGDAVNLEIWVDRPRQIQASSTSTKILWESAVNISQQFPWSHGTKQVNIRNTTAGLRKQWLDAWKPTSSTQRALILEDDIEVSQYFWRWLKAVHNRYADSEDICGFTLQRAQLCARSIECGSRELHGGPVQDGHSFAMPLVGSWGFSPTARHWSKFRAWAANFSGKPSVPGLKQDEWYRLFQKQGRCPGLNCMWTILHLKYTSIFKDSKTVYFKGPSGTALAISHREPGLHYARSGGADAALLQLWSDSFVRFPNRLPDVSLGGKLVSSYLSDSEEDLYKITLGGKLNSQASSDPDEAVVREGVAKWRSLNRSQNAPPVQSEIPVVLVGIDYQLFKKRVPPATIPFLCTRNPRVVVLTNVEQQQQPQDAPCLEIVDMSVDIREIRQELPWPQGAPKIQLVFFLRWFLIRNWMRRAGQNKILAIDSDAMVTANISELAVSNAATLAQADIWLWYFPPATTGAFILISLAALEDVTRFWVRMLRPDVWPQQHVGGTLPNDMVAFGHYVHTQVGKPYPCWGVANTSERAKFCDPMTGSSGYGFPDILAAIQRVGLQASFKTSSLSIYPDGTAALDFGIVDHNFNDNPMQIFAMVGSKKQKQKQLRFVNGQPQLLLRSGSWVPTWGYILEDKYEACVQHHLRWIRSSATCRCSNLCCSDCFLFPLPTQKTLKKCPHGLVYAYGMDDPNYVSRCLQENVFTWNTSHSESHHSFNTYLWKALQQSPCSTKFRSQAHWFFAVQDFFSLRCRSRLLKMLRAAPEWEQLTSSHVVFVWSGGLSTAEWKQGIAVHSADDSLRSPVQVTARDDGTSTTLIYKSWGTKGLTSPYWYTAPLTSPVNKSRSILVAGAWSNSRGDNDTMKFRTSLSDALMSTSRGKWIDTTVTKYRHWGSEAVTAMYQDADFCVVVPGSSPSSRRLSTCILAGSIPVMCSDKFVPPFPFLRWDAFSLRVPESACIRTVQSLQQEPKEKELLLLKRELAEVQPYFNMRLEPESQIRLVEALLESLHAVSKQ